MTGLDDISVRAEKTGEKSLTDNNRKDLRCR